MIAVKRKRAELIAIILARNRQNRQSDLLVLFGRRRHRVVIRVGGRMFEDTLEICGGISDERIQGLKWNMFLIRVQIFRAPKLLVTKKIVLGCAPTGEREPLHIVSFADVVERGIIERGMRCSNRHDRRKMRGQFFGGRPLIKSRVRSAPHRDFAVAEWLLRQPFHDVVSIAGFICEWLKLATGISAATNIDKRKCVTVRCEVCGAGMIRIGDVRRQSENHRRL